MSKSLTKFFSSAKFKSILEILDKFKKSNSSDKIILGRWKGVVDKNKNYGYDCASEFYD